MNRVVAPIFVIAGLLIIVAVQYDFWFGLFTGKRIQPFEWEFLRYFMVPIACLACVQVIVKPTNITATLIWLAYFVLPWAARLTQLMGPRHALYPGSSGNLWPFAIAIDIGLSLLTIIPFVILQSRISKSN